MPRSIRPVTTVPRPEIENTSSIGIRNGWSIGRSGCGMYSSTAAISFKTASLADLRLPVLQRRQRRTAHDRNLVAGNSYFDNSSRTSISTSSKSSGSSTMSTLFMNTTSAGTPTWRASRMCSRVCGIGPSAADTTRIAPSICAAPVIMFFT